MVCFYLFLDSSTARLLSCSRVFLVCSLLYAYFYLYFLLLFFFAVSSIFIAGSIRFLVLLRTTFKFNLFLLLWSKLQRSQCSVQRVFVIKKVVSVFFVSDCKFHSFSVKSCLFIVRDIACLNLISSSHLLL